jgi:hypothetical protein
MTIQKQQFYEGAALHILACNGGLNRLRYDRPFFRLNDELMVYFKYSTKNRSPWGFTFASAEQRLLHTKMPRLGIVIALVCGSDGVAALDGDQYQAIATERPTAIHLSCCRLHGEHYDISGPDGTLARKVAPSKWPRLLER